MPGRVARCRGGFLPARRDYRNRPPLLLPAPTATGSRNSPDRRAAVPAGSSVSRGRWRVLAPAGPVFLAPPLSSAEPGRHAGERVLPPAVGPTGCLAAPDNSA